MDSPVEALYFEREHHALRGCTRYGPGQHTIEPGRIDADALRVYQGLRSAGFDAYLVGGCVRDLLLGHEPKDFDVSTNARPEEIRSLFRRARIVGRRFQIVHVHSGREMIEVSTFRGDHSPDFGSEPESDEPGNESSAICAESGMLLRDNVFGSVEDDARRRDFTVNGLYYDPETNSVLDFSTGVADLASGLLRVIGDPVRRFQEDPVRMLRAIRFAAKLNFLIDDVALKAMAECRNLLRKVSPARMFDEVLKLLLGGYGEQSLTLLREQSLFGILFPETNDSIEHDPSVPGFLMHALRNSDQRIAQDKPVTPAFLYAALLWPALRRHQHALEQTQQASPFVALHQAIPEVIQLQSRSTTIPRRFATPMREIWEMQHRLVARRQPAKLAEHPRFRAAYDFILLREQNGEMLNQVGEWWTKYQSGASVPAVATPAKAPRRRRSRSRRSNRGDAH